MHPRQPDSFQYRRWNSTTNSDLALAYISPTPEWSHQLIQLGPAVKRWNFQKGIWLWFTHLADNKICCLPDPGSADLCTFYTSICKALLMAAKRTILQCYCHSFIPTWDEECDSHYKTFLSFAEGEETAQTTTDLMQCLNMKCKQHWEDAVQSIDFTYCSRAVWKTFSHLTRCSSQSKCCPVTANSIAHHLLLNGKFKEADKAHFSL